MPLRKSQCRAAHTHHRKRMAIGGAHGDAAGKYNINKNMSLQIQEYPVPEETARIARAVYRKGNPYMQIRDKYGMIYTDVEFMSMYKERGRPGVSPARLAMVVVMQTAENLSDEEAVEAVAGRIDWKYMLGMRIDESSFDASILVDFRKRLQENKPEELLLNKFIQVMKAAGMLKAGGKYRTDATHVLGAVRELTRMELVYETYRHALETLAEEEPGWLMGWLSEEEIKAYEMPVKRKRFLRGGTGVQQYVTQIGRDGYRLLERINEMQGGSEDKVQARLRKLVEVQALREIWIQQYEQVYDESSEARVIQQRAAGNLPNGGKMIQSPHDLSVRYAQKRDEEWVGYKKHLTESYDEIMPNLVVHVETTPASRSDESVVTDIHAHMKEQGIAPAQHLVDQGYSSAKNIVESRMAYGVNLVTPVGIERSPQALANQGYASADFKIDWGKQSAVCPQGKTNKTWVNTHKDGTAIVQIGFSADDCKECRAKALCTRAAGREITLRTQAGYEALQHAREYQKTAAFKTQYAKRAGIEGTIAQGVYTLDMRYARYIGLAKNKLHGIFQAVGLNLLRLGNYLAGIPKAKTRVAHIRMLSLAAT